jgi:hypothetical protein
MIRRFITFWAVLATFPVVAFSAERDTDGAAKTLLGWKFGAESPTASGQIITDRPDFTESSTTVGKGRVQIEAGYTYFRDRENGVTTHAHSYPEILTRIGLFRDWFELRIGQNFLSESIRPRTVGNGASGATDLYLGTKIALTEQKGIFPEMAIIFQTTVPTGSRTFTSNKTLPGISLLYSWELNDRFSLAGTFLGNKAVDDDGHGYTELANSISLGTSITEKIGNYVEYFAFYPHSGTASGLKPRYFLNSGFTYLVNSNIQLDIRAGVGLNKAADDFFIGSGLAVRY